MGFFDYLMKNLGNNDLNKSLANEKTELLNTNRSNFETKSDDSVAIVVPKNFQDIVDLVGYISGGHTAVVDFNQLSTNTLGRSIDFLSGAIFALNGEMKNISEGLYLYAPNGVKLIKPNKRKNK